MERYLQHSVRLENQAWTYESADLPSCRVASGYLQPTIEVENSAWTYASATLPLGATASGHLQPSMLLENSTSTYLWGTLPSCAAGTGHLQSAMQLTNPVLTLASSELPNHAFESEYLQPNVLPENPPWTYESATVRVNAAGSGVISNTSLNAEECWGGWFAHTLLNKIESIDTSQSSELNRQVLLARYDSDLRLRAAQHELIESTLWSPLTVSDTNLFLVAPPIPLRNPFQELFRARSFQYAHVILLSFFCNLIDRIADYFNQCAQAWALRKFALVLLAFRQQIKSGLVFKSRNRPLSLFRNSLHPIGQAA
jgi:hypothetical protein